MDEHAAHRPARTAFLLSQLGSLSSARFGDRVRAIGLTPSEAGILRLLGRAPGLNQRQLADRLGSAPSRIVPLIDALEARGLVERVRSATDRRHYELGLTGSGRKILRDLRSIAEEHEAEILEPLPPEDRRHLGSLLAALAEGHLAEGHLPDGEVHRGTAG